MNPAALLLLLALRHYAYPLAPTNHAVAWQILGAAVFIVLVWRVCPPGWPRLIAAWWTVEEALVIGCAGWYAWRPWPVEPDEDVCSSLVGADLGMVGAAVLALLSLRLSTYKGL
jgi:hypothetical protein